MATLAGCNNSSNPAATTPASTGPGTVGFAASTTAAAQIAGAALIPVTRVGGSTGALTISYATSDGTALSVPVLANLADYTRTTGTLTWADGDSATKTIYVPLTTTLNYWGIRTFTVTLSGLTGGATLGTASTTVNAAGGLNAPAPGTLAFTSNTAATSVLNGFITLSVARATTTAGVDPSSGAVTVGYATANGTATAGTDYTATSGTLSWTDNDPVPTKTITIPLNSASVFTGNRTFTVTLSSPTGTLGAPTLGTNATVTVALSTASVTGTIGFTFATATANQYVTKASIPVSRTLGTVGTVGISYATADGSAVAGTNYTATSGTLSWAAGDSSTRTITVPVVSTPLFNGTKTFTVSLNTPTGSPNLGTTSNTVTLTGMVAPSTCTGFNFSPWYLQLPIDQYGGTGGTNGIQYAATSASTAQVQAGFVDPYFYADSSCNLLFTAPSNGAVTSPGVGSDHTRSELRELYTGTGADSNSDWNSSIGGTLTATGQVNSVSAGSDIATIAQIHGQSLVFMLLVYRPSSNDIAVDIYNTNSSTSTHTRTSVATGITLGSTFTYKIVYLANTMAVTVNGSTQSFPIDSSWANTPVYFKLGAYHSVTNTGNPAGDQTQVSFSSFSVSH
ncbi:MAG TPA: polysaccharide lyase family 7 protein [Acidobacteriaceae bacterium]